MGGGDFQHVLTIGPLPPAGDPGQAARGASIRFVRSGRTRGNCESLDGAGGASRMAAGEDERGHAAARQFDAIFVGYSSTSILSITASSDRIGLKVLRHRSLPRRGGAHCVSPFIGVAAAVMASGTTLLSGRGRNETATSGKHVWQSGHSARPELSRKEPTAPAQLLPVALTRPGEG